MKRINFLKKLIILVLSFLYVLMPMQRTYASSASEIYGRFTQLIDYVKSGYDIYQGKIDDVITEALFDETVKAIASSLDSEMAKDYQDQLNNLYDIATAWIRGDIGSVVIKTLGSYIYVYETYSNILKEYGFLNETNINLAKSFIGNAGDWVIIAYRAGVEDGVTGSTKYEAIMLTQRNKVYENKQYAVERINALKFSSRAKRELLIEVEKIEEIDLYNLYLSAREYGTSLRAEIVPVQDVIYYFPTGGMSWGALMDVADDYSRLVGSKVTALGVHGDPTPCFGLSFTSEGYERVLQSDAIQYGVFDLFYDSSYGKRWTMSDVLINSRITLDQSAISPLFVYEITIDKFIPSEMHEFHISTDEYDPIENNNEENIAIFSIFPYDEDPYPSDKVIGISFPAQNVIIMNYIGKGEDDHGIAPQARDYFDLSQVDIGGSVSINGSIPNDSFTPYTITIKKLAMLH